MKAVITSKYKMDKARSYDKDRVIRTHSQLLVYIHNFKNFNRVINIGPQYRRISLGDYLSKQ